jgi:hypothetical protein
VAFRCFNERRVQTTPETSATGVVPRGDQMHVPGAVWGDEPEDVPADTVLGPVRLVSCAQRWAVGWWVLSIRGW